MAKSERFAEGGPYGLGRVLGVYQGLPIAVLAVVSAGLLDRSEARTELGRPLGPTSTPNRPSPRPLFGMASQVRFQARASFPHPTLSGR